MLRRLDKFGKSVVFVMFGPPRQASRYKRLLHPSGHAGWPRRLGSPILTAYCGVRFAKELKPMLDRDTIELLAGFFAIVTFGVVLVLIQQ